VGIEGRILALDLGKKRIGLAISDELGITAQGLETLERQGRRDDIESLRKLALARGVTRFLLGDPLHMSGDASRQAERTIRGEGVANKSRKPTIDMLSAVILLQSYLDAGNMGVR
jgi:putative Holliday junction resolvase